MQKQGQGAIEYLLIIGAAILVVAVVIIGIGGLLSATKEETSQEEYQDSYADLKYEHIGFPITVKPAEHISFTLAVQPKENSLPEIFSTAPTGTEVTINYTNTFRKEETEWTSGGDNVKINQGDIVDVTMPQDATKDLSLNIKGNYTSPPQRKIRFNCTGANYESYSSTLPFVPTEINVKVIFKDFFENPKAGSNLSISGINSYYNYYGINKCEGTPCINLTTEAQCNDTWGTCAWSQDMMGEGACYSQYQAECSWFASPWDNTYCERVGCNLSQEVIIYDEMGYPDSSNPTYNIGDSISLSCVPGQTITAEIKENKGENADAIEQLTLENYSEKKFMLKNYSCYSFDKLYNKIKNSITADPNNYYLQLFCSSRGATVYRYQYNAYGYSYEYFDNTSILIYPDTICTVYTYGHTNQPIQLTC